MLAPLRNLRVAVTTIVQLGVEKQVIRLDFDRMIFSSNPDDFYFLYKYEIPENEFNVDDFIASGGGVLHFLENDLVAGEGLYAGGYAITNPPQKMDITSNIQKGAFYLLDKNIRDGYTYLYEFLYRYNGRHYSLADISSTKEAPFINIDQADLAHQACIRRRNYVFRNEFPRMKENNYRQEVFEDLKFLEDGVSSLTLSLQNATLYDDYFSRVYALEDSVTYLTEQAVNFGFGTGRYGRKGGYGF